MNGKVPIQSLINNLVGNVEDTLDGRIQAYKQLYLDIIQSKQRRFVELCEIKDTQNTGRIAPNHFQEIVQQLSSIQLPSLQGLCRQIAKPDGTISYIEFIDNVIALGNKQHNPVQKLVQKIEIFLHENKMTAKGLINKLDSETSVGIPVKDFTAYC